MFVHKSSIKGTFPKILRLCLFDGRDHFPQPCLSFNNKAAAHWNLHVSCDTIECPNKILEIRSAHRSRAESRLDARPIHQTLFIRSKYRYLY